MHKFSQMSASLAELELQYCASVEAFNSCYTRLVT